MMNIKKALILSTFLVSQLAHALPNSSTGELIRVDYTEIGGLKIELPVTKMENGDICTTFVKSTSTETNTVNGKVEIHHELGRFCRGGALSKTVN